MGVFINIDGTNGSGKTSLVKDVTKRLEDKGYKIYMTNEPGGTSIGMRIREILLSIESSDMDKIAETMLFFADRAQHYKEVLSKVKDYDAIISDRFVASTYVYQHMLKGVDKEVLDTLYKYATRGLKPDLSIYVLSDKPHSIDENDRFDKESIKKRKEIISYYEILKHMDLSKNTEYMRTDKGDWNHYKDIMTHLIEDQINK